MRTALLSPQASVLHFSLRTGINYAGSLSSILYCPTHDGAHLVLCQHVGSWQIQYPFEKAWTVIARSPP